MNSVRTLAAGILSRRGLPLFSGAVMVALIMTAGASAVERVKAPATQPSGEIARLIAQLSDPRWKVRNSAVDRLVEFQASAEPELRVARESAASVDLRSRIELALDRIRQSRRFGATYVTLHLNNATPRQAIDALARQAGVKIDCSAVTAAGGKINLHADHKPFWLVFRDLAAQAKFELASIDEDGLITLRTGDESWGLRPADIEGPYLLVARRLELNRALDFARPGDVSNNYTLVLQAYVEPKIRPISWAVLGVDQCVTETGRAIRQSPRDSLETGDLNSDGETRFSFSTPPDAGRQLARLRFVARFVICEQTRTIEIGDILKTRRDNNLVGGWRMTIKGQDKTDDDRRAVSVTVYRDDHSSDEWAERTGLLDRAQPRLFDADGRQIDSGGTSLNEGPDEWTWTDEFAAGASEANPSRLQWEFPLTIRHTDVSFEFRNLPLP